MQRLIDAIHLEQSLPTSSPADNNHVMTRNFAITTNHEHAVAYKVES